MSKIDRELDFLRRAPFAEPSELTDRSVLAFARARQLERLRRRRRGRLLVGAVAAGAFLTIALHFEGGEKLLDRVLRAGSTEIARDSSSRHSPPFSEAPELASATRSTSASSGTTASSELLRAFSELESLRERVEVVRRLALELGDEDAATREAMLDDAAVYLAWIATLERRAIEAVRTPFQIERAPDARSEPEPAQQKEDR